MQKFIYDYCKIENLINLKEIKPFVICTRSAINSEVMQFLKDKNTDLIVFSSFKPNPTYENVVEALESYEINNCNFIISLGGGSAIDIAKSVKAFISLDKNVNYLQQKIVKNNIKHLAIPTTAGTGSESTHFAVIYYNQKKYSVADLSLLPDYVLLEPDFLKTLPLSQKKSTMLDALSQGIESYWCLSSTKDSKVYAKKAITLILDNYQKYLSGDSSVNLNMMKASNYSGRAINITKTTAPHALSYKLTSLYGISHGYAVALCLPYVWEYMINNIDLIGDKERVASFDKVLSELDYMFKSKNHNDSIKKLFQIYKEIDFKTSHIVKKEDINVLLKSVNLERLANNPVKLNLKAIEGIYTNLI